MNIKKIIAAIFLFASLGFFVLAAILLTTNMINIIELLAAIIEFLFAIFCFVLFLHFLRQSRPEKR